MVKIYIGGGASFQRGESKHITEPALSDAGESPSVLIFPWTGKDVTGYRDVMTKYFEEFGVKEIVYTELEDSHQDIADKLDSSDLVYMPGGDTLLLLERLKPFQDLIRAYDKVILGNSAGSLVLAEEFAIFRDQPQLLPALGVVNFAISVHYNTKTPKYGTRDEGIHKKLSQSTNLKLYAIEEKCAMVYDSKDSSFSFIGKTDVFQNGELVEQK